MIISVINHSNGRISDPAAQRAIRAVNRQVAEDFLPYWGFGAQLRLEGRVGKRPGTQQLADMRGEAVLYLWDRIDVADAAGYHERNFRGVPYSIVHVDLADELQEPWSVTFSHEALELIGDPQCNLVSQGPHPDPAQHRRMVFHWFEMCDAVQSESYEIDAVPVSNFVLPLYFTAGEQPGGRNDFLGTQTRGRTLHSFGVNPGGYVGFFDPRSRKDSNYATDGDSVAQARMKIKHAAGTGRGNQRRARTREWSTTR